MKHFNQNNQDDPIQFFGMDIQFYNSYLSSIEYNYPEELISQYRIVTNDSLLSKYPSKGRLILEIENSKIGTDEKIKQFQSLSKSLLNDELALKYYLLTRMYNLRLTEPKDLNARDRYMAELVGMIQRRFGQKAIIWAHNWHISRLNDPELNYISAGYHISNIYKDDYSVIGFDFQKGSFNAISLTESKRKAFKYRKIAETLASDLIFGTKEYLITDCSSLEVECYVNSIGATYVDEPTDIERYYSKIHKNIEFDYFISIPKSSPSVLISSF